MSKEWSKETFAKNLNRYISLSGKTQREIAAVAGVSEPTMSDWLKAKKYPRIDKIQKLADYFGILKSELIEEKISEETKKDNDIMANIIVRMRVDDDFHDLVQALYVLDEDKINGVKQMLQAFFK